MTEKELPKKIFGKCFPVKIIVCVFWGLIALPFFLMGIGLVGEVEEYWLWFIVGFLFLIPIFKVFAKKLIISDDHITIKSGIIFKKSEDISYKKINNIEKSEAFGMGTLIFYTGNDKGTKFKNLESYDVVHDYINSKIGEKS